MANEGALHREGIVENIIDAHGGRGLWERLHAIEAVISVRGALFTLKRRPTLERVTVTALAHEARFLFHDYLAAGHTGELIGNDEVRILGPDGSVLEWRSRPRASMTGPGKFFSWDALDFAYFGGYATWNYLVAPFLFLFEGVRCEALATPHALPESWLRLRVHFPDSVPTHCATQDFYFDEQFRLRRLDYVAEVVGRWARAAHLCEEYRDFEGFKAPTRRRVHPLFAGLRPLPGPTLVAIDIHRIRLAFGASDPRPS
jgi:hypothetical protein